MKHQESRLQSNCIALFRLRYPQLRLNIFAVPNGGGRNKVEASIMKGEGVTAGVADVLLLVPRAGYHALAIEFKKEYRELLYSGRTVLRRTYQSDEQKEWQKAVEAQGYKYVVVRTADEFWSEIEAYMGEKTCNGQG